MKMNSIISWVGGKKALREMIYQRMPKEFGRYIEVFGGGGWVLFGRTPDTAMEVYNDFNSDLANLFRCVRDRPFALLKELNFLPLNGRDEFNVLKKYLGKEEFTAEYLLEELEIAQRYLTEPQFEEIKPILLENAQMNDVKRAAAFYRLIRLSYGSGCTSYGCQPFDIRKTFRLLWQGSQRLKDTVIENKDFEELIKQYDRENAFIYCDPPYYQTEGHYAVELAEYRKVIERNYALHVDNCPVQKRVWRGKPYANFLYDCDVFEFCISYTNVLIDTLQIR